MSDKKDKLIIKLNESNSYQSFSVRVQDDMLEEIDNIVAKSGKSRNHIINVLLRYALDNTELE